MNQFKYIMFAGIAISAWSASAQVADGSLGYYQDARIFSQTSPVYGSTARMQGLGGAQISLGADMSSAGSNPAGLGFFNRSVLSFTPSMTFNNSDASYFGNTISTYKNNFNFANLGMVFNSNKGDYTNEKFKGGSFAITFNRSNNFNSEVFYQGRNTSNSIVDSFVEGANNDLSDAYIDYAFGQFLIENADGYLYQKGADGRTYIYPDGDFDGYTSLVGTNSYDGYLPRQIERITTKGGQSALNFAWGGNYDDRVYFGAGLSFESVRYSRIRTYTEDSFRDVDGNQDDLLYKIQIQDELTIDGSGVGFNGGLIVRPVDFVTLGLSYKSPTYYSLNDESGFTFATDWNENYSYYNGTNSEGDSVFYDMGSYKETSDLTMSQYNLKTPGKLSLGATFFLGKVGFISGDVEFVDYTRSQLKSNDFSVVADNQTIKNLYTNTMNFRIGSEFRYDDFRFRAGYAFFGDAFANNDSFDGRSQNVSFGLGYRSRDYFIDLAVVNRKSFDAYSPYQISTGTPIADIEQRTNTVSATIGFNF